jgi:hypothetical protein
MRTRCTRHELSRVFNHSAVLTDLVNEVLEHVIYLDNVKYHRTSNRYR